MKNSIAFKILFSHLMLVIFSMMIVTAIIFTYAIRNNIDKKVENIKQLQFSWTTIENNIYLSMSRWDNGNPYETARSAMGKLDDNITHLSDAKQQRFLPEDVKEQLVLLNNLWQYSKETFIDTLFTKIDNFVVSGEIENLEDENKRKFIKINPKNYYKVLNIRELCYSSSQDGWTQYVTEGLRMLENVDQLYASNQAFIEKVNIITESSLEYNNLVQSISLFIIVILLVIQIIIGIFFASLNARKLSVPILKASNKLLDFVGESLAKTDKTDSKTNDDELTQHIKYIDLIIQHYEELSITANRLSLGDAKVNITPKSDHDVMALAFQKIKMYLERLTEGAKEIINGNYEYQIEESCDEDIPAKTFNKLSNAIIDLLDKTQSMARLESELNAASQIQSSILPPEVTELKNYDCAHTLITATEVGGDNYDFRHFNGINWIEIGDVSGHGLESGIIALIAQSAFNMGTILFSNFEVENPPRELYRFVNSTLYQLSRVRGQNDAFMTQNYFYEKDGKFICSGAHEVGLVYRGADKSVEELKGLAGNVPFMGIIDSSGLECFNYSFTFEMNKDDVLLLYTDGLIEPKNADREQFDLFRIKDILKENGEKDVETIKQILLESVTEFARGGDYDEKTGKFPDDITIIVLKKQ